MRSNGDAVTAMGVGVSVGLGYGVEVSISFEVGAGNGLAGEDRAGFDVPTGSTVPDSGRGVPIGFCIQPTLRRDAIISKYSTNFRIFTNHARTKEES